MSAANNLKGEGIFLNSPYRLVDLCYEFVTRARLPLLIP
jgi:hypothetical protein